MEENNTWSSKVYLSFISIKVTSLAMKTPALSEFLCWMLAATPGAAGPGRQWAWLEHLGSYSSQRSPRLCSGLLAPTLAKPMYKGHLGDEPNNGISLSNRFFF